MKTNHLISALGLFCTLSTSAFALCPKTNPQDTFEIDRTIIVDRKKECLDKRARSIKLLSVAEAKNFVGSVSENNHYIANLHHAGEFWIGEIPKNTVKEVVIQEEIFMDLYITKAAHVQLRFNFPANAPVKLYSQKNANSKTSKLGLNGLILSFEALGYENGPEFSLLETMGNPFKDNDVKFQLVSRSMSVADSYQDFVINKKHKVRQFLLDGSKINLNKILEIGLNKASANYKIRQKYDLIFRNCTNVIFEILDASTRNSRDIFDRSVTAYPALTINALKARKIFKKELTNMNKEKPAYLNMTK